MARSRYTLVPKSVSAHCCFEATVLDTSKTTPGAPHYMVCETFTVKDAELIRKALNFYHKNKPKRAKKK